MGLLPEATGDLQRLEFALLPPGWFIAGLVQRAVMAATKRHRELVADLHADGARLGKAEMVGIAGSPVTDEAWLRGHKVEMRPVADPLRLRDGKGALVDPT